MKTVNINLDTIKNENFNTIKLSQTIDVKTQATTPEEAPKPQGFLAGFIPLLPFVIIFFAFYLLIIRPGNKKQKELADKVAKVKKDDKVRTAGGIIAIVDKVDDNEVVLKVDEKTKITFVKSAIVEIYSAGLTPAK